MNSMLRVVIILLGIIFSAQAEIKCIDDLRKLFRLKGEEEFQISENPLEQLRLWEQTSNTKRWAKPTEAIEVEFVSIASEELRVTELDVSGKLSQFLHSSNGKVRWLRHPGNTASSVPYKDTPAEGTVQFHYSASRSMFADIDGEFYSFKLPTNRPHPVGDVQSGKADLKNDSILSIRRSQYINQVEEIMGQPTNYKILTEVASIAANTNGNGFSIRDLRPLQDGNYYMPAFSIPYAGKKIANVLEEDFWELWGKGYIEALGAAKAQLLIRYGLQMKTPNAQNWLVQLGPDLRPTGVIVMRDLADSNFIGQVAEHNGAAKFLQMDKDDNFSVASALNLNFSNSVWQMSEGGLKQSDIDQKWGHIHWQAYLRTVMELLDIDAEAEWVTKINSEASLQTKFMEWIKTDEGKAKLSAFASKNGLL